jgi:hypothetical protein
VRVFDVDIGVALVVESYDVAAVLANVEPAQQGLAQPCVGHGGPLRAWLARRPAASIAVVLGLASFVVVAVAQPALWSVPDWRLSVPGLAATAVAALISLARREPAGYSLLGLGLASAALVLGCS